MKVNTCTSMSIGGCKRHRERKRHQTYDDDIEKRRIKKNNAAALREESVSSNIMLPSEYQPQFMGYQLIGDRISFMILHSEEVLSDNDLAWCRNYAESTSGSVEILTKLTSAKNYPIAKRIIVSVGYNDSINRKITAQDSLQNIRLIINELRRKGCRDIILTDVPPCALHAPVLDHWRYLEIINSSLQCMYEKTEDVTVCSIFPLFCRPADAHEKHIYILENRKANFKVESSLYNKYTHKKNLDLITFSSAGRFILRTHLRKVAERRLKYYLVFDVAENHAYYNDSPKISDNRPMKDEDIIIIDDESDNITTKEKAPNDIIKIDDSDSDNDCDVVLVSNDVNKRSPINIIDVDDTENETDDSLKNVHSVINENYVNVTHDKAKTKSDGAEITNIADTETDSTHPFGCECRACKAIDRRLILGFLTTLSSLEKETGILENEDDDFSESEINKKPKVEKMSTPNDGLENNFKIQEVYLPESELESNSTVENVNLLKSEAEKKQTVEKEILFKGTFAGNTKSEKEEINPL